MKIEIVIYAHFSQSINLQLCDALGQNFLFTFLKL